MPRVVLLLPVPMLVLPMELLPPLPPMLLPPPCPPPPCPPPAPPPCASTAPGVMRTTHVPHIKASNRLFMARLPQFQDGKTKSIVINLSAGATPTHHQFHSFIISTPPGNAIDFLLKRNEIG